MWPNPQFLAEPGLSQHPSGWRRPRMRARGRTCACPHPARYVYSSDNFTGRLFVMNTGARRVVDTIEVGLRP